MNILNKKKYLNLGCGSRFHKDWINLDFVSNNEFVIPHNLESGIPFNDNFAEFIYHSHVLEHFSKTEGEKFIKECYRVLKPNGVIRIAVPDLEQLAIEYIKALNEATINDNELSQANYKWSVIELIDQLVRKKSGGEMLEYWKKKDLINETHIKNRIGHEYCGIRINILKSKHNENKPTKENYSLKTKIKLFIYKKLKVNIQNLEEGSFINSGEIHQWMYDKYSMRKLLTEIGFNEIKIQKAETSYLKDWNEYSFLDIENNQVRKPDSLFIEAIK